MSAAAAGPASGADRRAQANDQPRQKGPAAGNAGLVKAPGRLAGRRHSLAQPCGKVPDPARRHRRQPALPGVRRPPVRAGIHIRGRARREPSPAIWSTLQGEVAGRRGQVARGRRADHRGARLALHQNLRAPAGRDRCGAGHRQLLCRSAEQPAAAGAHLFALCIAACATCASAGYARVVIVSHSQGTVISADLLRYLHVQGRLQDVTGGDSGLAGDRRLAAARPVCGALSACCIAGWDPTPPASNPLRRAPRTSAPSSG